LSNATPADATNPDHYKRLDPEPIFVIERWGLSFCLGNAVKYIARAGYKLGVDAAEDLAKAAWYLQRARAPQMLAVVPDEVCTALEESRREAMRWRITAERLAVRIRDRQLLDDLDSAKAAGRVLLGFPLVELTEAG
jgi:hypothetical protein